MATKTVVCPECGASADPGRYACAQCGALLATVGMQPRDLTTLVPGGHDEVDESAPLSMAAGASAADDVADPGFDTAPALDLSPSSPGLPEILRPAAPSWPSPAPGPAPAAPAVAYAAPVVAAGRHPAGAYLPPSAVLPPLDGPSVAVAAAGAVPVATRPATATQPSGRRLPSLGDLVGNVEVPASLTRRTVGVGAAIAAISFLLPWANGLPGAGLTGYLDRWGLAGPALWIVFVATAAIGAIALSSGRPAGWSVGLPAVVLGGLLVGLAWPGVFGRGAAIGMWFAFVGALVLVVGGALDLRARHALVSPSA